MQRYSIDAQYGRHPYASTEILGRFTLVSQTSTKLHGKIINRQNFWKVRRSLSIKRQGVRRFRIASNKACQKISIATK